MIESSEHVGSMRRRRDGAPYLLLPRLCDVLLGFEEGSDVHGLAPPEVSMDGPVERKFEGAPVERTIDLSLA